MSALMPVADALAAILKTSEVLASEDVALRQAAGRVLAQNISALRTQPPFPASAMDGYAVRADDIASAPANLTLVGESAAGHPFHGSISTNECVRIFTGAPVPEGADTILIQENAQTTGDSVTALQAEERGRYVRPAALDFAEGDELLSAGEILDAGSLSLAAAMNHPALPVRRRPLVAIIATGDELRVPGSKLEPGQIIASNTFGVAALVEKAGGKVLDLGIASDTMKSLEEKFKAAQGADIVVTLGGASVGDHDLVQDALETRGVTLDFWKLAMRPGKPVTFGTAPSGQRYLGLPGNPVSSLVCTTIFLAPLIKSMLGLPAQTHHQTARLAVDLPQNNEREEYARATYELMDGDWWVTPAASQDSSIIRLYHQSNCLLIRPANAPALKRGATCHVVPL
ncbi:gephyrin-like molybdotransferase Glp [Pseudahrensia aquimaris]|uniref:Molybdopterin molybdenumtransferase n=1 Tax=Pseudahrensia aquimaris TaxID=744461 RepID=A0ABW3FLA2_9HYPH